jgi:UDP-N-acetylmuramoylalanine--D-glutamate ligase
MSQLNLLNKDVVVVGLGLTGLSCLRFLTSKGANVTGMDSRSTLEIDLDVDIYLGEFDPIKLCKAQLIVVSPGVSMAHPAIQTALDKGIKVIGDIELFACFNDKPVIAVTGSNGKSTVVTLIAEMFKAGGKTPLLGGNIGVPALELLEQHGDVVVLELSSFQLESTHSLRPLVACMLNLSDDHLDRHGDMQNYRNVKLRVYQQASFIVCNRDDANTYPQKGTVNMSFGLAQSESGFSWDIENNSIILNGEIFLHANDCLLIGAHNVLNIQAAAAMAFLAGLPVTPIKQGAMTFGGLPHRCQTVSLYKNIRWINDSKATNVGATIAAIQGLHGNGQGKLILIAGGDGKGADFSPLSQAMNSVVDVLITLGKDGKQIAKLKSGSITVSSLEQAVQQAERLAKANDVVLLSPACASLDMFDNYQQRGECFIHAVKALAA